MAAETPDIDIERTYLFHQLDEYPWDQDQEFQGGLRAILGSVQDPAQVEHLTLRAKCYYYARKSGTAVDFNGYKQWVEAQQGGGPVNGVNVAPTTGSATVTALPSGTAEYDGGGMGGIADAPKPASFAEICDLIAEGKPIPGIKEIPDTILEGQASDSRTSGRKKPWEKEAEANEKPTLSWMS